MPHLDEVLSRHEDSRGDLREREEMKSEISTPTTPTSRGMKNETSLEMRLVPTVYIPPDQRNQVRGSLETIPESVNGISVDGISVNRKGKEGADEEGEMGEVAKVRSWA